jgi:hypothetical protein
MDTEVEPAHFAWDLLDLTKQGAQKPELEQPAGDQSRHPETILALALKPEERSSVQDGIIAEPSPSQPLSISAEIASTSFPESGLTAEVAPFEADQSASEKSPAFGPGSEPLPVETDIPKIGWVDVGMTTEPGQHKSRYGMVQVCADEIWIWKQYPGATFVVMQPSPYSNEVVSRLGSFDLGDPKSNAPDDK